ncbi:hypothetical protein ADUPG1_003073, partial [Aduncisulcus paluster]
MRFTDSRESMDDCRLGLLTKSVASARRSFDGQLSVAPTNGSLPSSEFL